MSKGFYWIRLKESEFDEDVSGWHIAKHDPEHGQWWVFGLPGWIEIEEIEEVGSKIVRPQP